MSTPPELRETTCARTGSRTLRSRGSDELLPNAKPGPTLEKPQVCWTSGPIVYGTYILSSHRLP